MLFAVPPMAVVALRRMDDDGLSGRGGPAVVAALWIIGEPFWKDSSSAQAVELESDPEPFFLSFGYPMAVWCRRSGVGLVVYGLLGPEGKGCGRVSGGRER